MLVRKKKQKNYYEIIKFLNNNNFIIYKKFNENYIFKKKIKNISKIKLYV